MIVATFTSNSHILEYVSETVEEHMFLSLNIIRKNYQNSGDAWYWPQAYATEEKLRKAEGRGYLAPERVGYLRPCLVKGGSLLL